MNKCGGFGYGFYPNIGKSDYSNANTGKEMNADTLQKIKEECEKIEKSPGFGEVTIKIQNGVVKIIQPTTTILVKKT